MGQESSLPQQAGEDLEGPSKTSSSPLHSATAERTNHSGRPANMINAMLHRGAVAGQNQPLTDYEFREQARAAAQAGQMPYAEGRPSQYNGGMHSSHHQPQQMSHREMEQRQQPFRQSQHYGYVNGAQTMQPISSTVPSGNRQATGENNRNDRPAARGSSSRTNRGAALINSMRSLTLGRSSGSKKEASDWETKWDEDEDDDDSEDESEDKANHARVAADSDSSMRRTAPLHQPQRPGMDQGHSSLSTTSFSPRIDAQQNMQMTKQSHSAGERNTDTSVPTRDMRYANGQAPTGLPTNDITIDDGIQWDTGAQLSQDKPNVQMFLPLLRVLGKGSFGKVVLVQKQSGKERGSLFAMKILKKTHLVKRRQIERTRTERKVLSAVNHPFIMKLHYAFQSEDKLYLVLDYCPGGELFFHLSRYRRFPERVARFYGAELLLAIGHLHKRGIIYRDLKPENVLLDADGHIKLGDFGLAKAGLKHPCEGASSMCGTPEYMAPEVLNQQGHGFCVDYWGLGMLVYEMMTGLPPWYTTDRSKLFRRLKSAPLEIPSYFSALSANCISALLERNPQRRLGVNGVRTAMEHEFFRTINWRALYGRLVEAPIRPCEGWSPPEAVESGVIGDGLQGFNTAEVQQMNSGDLDAATANFDNTFTRMKVNTDDLGGEVQSDDGEVEELHEDMFIGFSFDDKDREAIAAANRRRTRQFAQTQHQLSNEKRG